MEGYLRCGRLEYGCLRLCCKQCGHEELRKRELEMLKRVVGTTGSTGGRARAAGRHRRHVVIGDPGTIGDGIEVVGPPVVADDPAEVITFEVPDGVDQTTVGVVFSPDGEGDWRPVPSTVEGGEVTVVVDDPGVYCWRGCKGRTVPKVATNARYRANTRAPAVDRAGVGKPGAERGARVKCGDRPPVSH